MTTTFNFWFPVIGIAAFLPCIFVYRTAESRVAGWANLMHGLCWWAFYAFMPVRNARIIDAFVGVTGAGRFVVELSGTAAPAFQYVFIAHLLGRWGRRSRRVLGLYALLFTLYVACYWLAHVIAVPWQLYYLGPVARPWPLLGVNLLSGSMVALLAGLVTLSYMHARRRAETRKERVLSRIYTFVYAVMFGYGLWEIAETLSHLFRGTATGLQPYRAPLFVVTVTLAIGGQWYSTMLPKLRNWASDHLGAGHIYARMLDLNALLTDRVVKMYADRETFARTLRSLGWDGRKGYWGAIAHEAARWMSLSPTGHVAAPSHRSGLAPEVAGTADNISHPSLAIAEARYYTNTYQSVALAAPQMRPDGLPPAPSPTNQHIALVHGTRAANVGRTSASRAKAQALTVGRHVPAMRRVIDLKEMEATLLAANVWLTDQQVHLHADPAAIHAVACCLDKRGVRGYRRRVALEAARWVVLTRAGLAATLAEEAGVAPETVGLASGGYMPLPLTIGRLERELSRLYRDVYRVGVLVDGDENLPGSDLALREWRRWHQEIAALIRGVLPPFDVEERILAAKANERGA